ncbi:MAG TPA: STAS domain-containing protein [Terriglobales bacterium]
MRDEPLTIQDVSSSGHIRILKLSGPLTITTLFEFQSLVRTNSSPKLILDFTNVPYVDSAGVGALVGAYVRHQKEGHSITLAGVNERVRGTLKVTQVDSFFQYADSFARLRSSSEVHGV